MSPFHEKNLITLENKVDCTAINNISYAFFSPPSSRNIRGNLPRRKILSERERISLSLSLLEKFQLINPVNHLSYLHNCVLLARRFV